MIFWGTSPQTLYDNLVLSCNALRLWADEDGTMATLRRCIGPIMFLVGVSPKQYLNAQKTSLGGGSVQCGACKFQCQGWQEPLVRPRYKDSKRVSIMTPYDVRATA